MSDDRYRVHDGSLLRRLMTCPEQGGTAYTVRSLAAETGLSFSKIQKLVTGDRPTVTEAEADSIASAVHICRRGLFAPTPSPFGDGNRKDDHRGSRRTHSSSPSRCTHELGEHDGPDDADR